MAISKLVPIIEEKLFSIFSFIDDIQDTYKNISVCSNSRKEYYKLGIQKRFEKLLVPCYELKF